MRLEKDKYLYDNMPEMGRIQSALVISSTSRFWNALCVAPWNEIISMRNRTRKPDGIPTFLAYLENKHQIMVFPTPDEDYDLRIRYYPPLQEI